MDYRFRSKSEKASLRKVYPKNISGPVITVSREAGCSGNLFVRDLARHLNKEHSGNDKAPRWQWVNKEVIYETAQELKVHPSRVYKLFKGEPRRLMDEVLESLSTRYYINDRTVTRAIGEIVKRFAVQGNVIILGRGGVGLARNISKSLHIKLHAPKFWRIEEISRKLNLNHEAAEAFVNETDRKRKDFLAKFNRDNWGPDSFDLSFNCMSMRKEDIIASISLIMKRKEID